MERLYKTSWRFAPFLWQEIDEGILPALYAAATPHAEGGAFYGPRGFYEAAGGGVAPAKVPEACPQRRRLPATVGAFRAAHRCQLPDKS